MPGAETPWRTVNQLLAPDERFWISKNESKRILLAPRHPSQIAALFYFLTQEGVDFSHRNVNDQDSEVTVTLRAFSQLHWHDHGIVEVGAGCQFSTLHSFLFERRHEVGIEPPPASSQKMSIAQALTEGEVGGYRTKGESPIQQIVGCDLVAWDGSQLRWGALHRAGPPGPSLYRVVGGEENLPGVVTKLFIKCRPIPQKRLSFAWSFRSQRELWKQYEALKKFSSSWELLDAVLAGDLLTTSFLFAQIAGLEEEMEIVAQQCPGFEMCCQEDKRGKVERFIQQEGLRARASSGDYQAKAGEYLWLQKMTSKSWVF